MATFLYEGYENKAQVQISFGVKVFFLLEGPVPLKDLKIDPIFMNLF